MQPFARSFGVTSVAERVLDRACLRVLRWGAMLNNSERCAPARDFSLIKIAAL